MDRIDKELFKALQKAGVEGVRKVGDNFLMDFDLDDAYDLLDLNIEQLHETTFDNHIYRFGYSFKPDADSNSRAQLVKWIKGLASTQPTPAEYHKFISRPLGLLNDIEPISSFTCTVYPDSGRSELVRKIVKVTNDFLQHGIYRPTYRLIKELPSKVEFDWDMFSSDVNKDEDPNRYNQMKAYIEQMLENLKSKEYFSIAESVKPKYRNYVTHYLTVSSEEDKQTLAALKQPKILIIDDINTTGATMHEILRVITSINPTATICIFTLIGKDVEA